MKKYEDYMPTKREIEIAMMLASGMKPKEVCESTHIAYNTYKNHAASLRRKLKVKDRLNLVLKTIEIFGIQ